MMKTGLKFGAFVAICVSFTLLLAFTIGNIDLRDPLGRDNFELSATFDDVTGLLINDNVKIAGVVVGKVTDIKVARGRAVVTFAVDNDYRDRLSTDTSAAIRWRNLIGQRYLYLYPGTASTTLEDGGEILETENVVDLGELFNNLGPIVASVDESQVNEFLDTVTQALDGNQDRVGQAIDDLAVLATGLATRDQSIGRLVENLNVVAGTITTRDQQIRTMLDNLVLLAATFSDSTDVIDAALTELGPFSEDLATLLSVNRDELDRIISTLDVVLQETVRPRIGQLDETLRGLDEAARAVFNAGRLGEWLNQTILCAAVGPPPPPPADSCLTPILTGASEQLVAANSAGSRAASYQTGVDAVTTLVGGEMAAASRGAAR